MAAKMVSICTCGPRPTPVMPSSVSTMTIGTEVTPSAKTPLASPTGRPHSWTVSMVRYPVTRMSALRGSGGDGLGDLALEDEVHREHGSGGDQHTGGEGRYVVGVLAAQ